MLTLNRMQLASRVGIRIYTKMRYVNIAAAECAIYFVWTVTNSMILQCLYLQTKKNIGQLQMIFLALPFVCSLDNINIIANAIYNIPYPQSKITSKDYKYLGFIIRFCLKSHCIEFKVFI